MATVGSAVPGIMVAVLVLLIVLFIAFAIALKNSAPSPSNLP